MPREGLRLETGSRHSGRNETQHRLSRKEVASAKGMRTDIDIDTDNQATMRTCDEGAAAKGAWQGCAILGTLVESATPSITCHIAVRANNPVRMTTLSKHH